jgi:phage shock protein C
VRAYHSTVEERMAAVRTSLRRSRTNRMVAGVVGGLAEYLGVDPTLARVVFVVVSIVSAAFPGLLVYGILWLVIPAE